nr:uncharacterized protein LOC128696061 [Cherax quadricarinatus]
MEGMDGMGERDYLVGTIQSEGHKVIIAVMYNPPQNCRRPREEYDESNRAMIDTLAEVARRAHMGGAKLLVMGDFNHKEIDWENLEPHGGPETWRAKMMDVVLENLMHQHVRDTTRERGEDEPARLDLVFTMSSSDIEGMRAKGITGKVGRWIYNFLTNRTQRVVVNRVKSEAATVKSSVPQGTVLAPILFLILISDIDKDVSHRSPGKQHRVFLCR